MWNSKNVFWSKLWSPSETHNSFTVFILTLNVKKFDRLEFSEKNFTISKSLITQTREKCYSYVLSRPDFLMVWTSNGILFVHFYFFLFRNNVIKGYLDESGFRHCYGNFYESAIPKVTWSATSKFLLHNHEAHWQEHFKKHNGWRFYEHELRYVLILSSRLK